LLRAGARREDINEARAQFARAAAALRAADDQIAYASIQSPMAGTVIKRGIEAGEMVSPGVSATAQGTSMLTVADLDHLVIKSSLNQIDIGKVTHAQHVDVRVDAAPGKLFPGRIHKIAPAADSKDKDKADADAIRTFPIETILLAGAGSSDARFLKPGMSAELDVHVAKKAQALYLPVEAVRRGKGDEGTVLLAPTAAGAKPAEQKVTIGLTNESQIEILKGLGRDQAVLLQPPASDSKAKM
jgi:HlyD family secretion protein